MSDQTSEQMGVSFSAEGIKEIQGDLHDLGQEVAATGRTFAAAVQRMQRATGRMRALQLPAILQAAQVSVKPSGVASVSTSSSGNRLQIAITINGGRGGAGGSGGGRVRAAMGGDRLRSLPRILRPTIDGPNQRRARIVDAIHTAQLLRDPAALADAQLAMAANEKRLTPRAQGFPAGPRQRMAALYEAMHRAISAGNFDAFDDAKEAYDKLRNRASGPRPGQRLAGLIGTTRFGAGGVSPLLGRALDIAGGTGSMLKSLEPILAPVEAMLSKLGPYGLVLVGLTEATKTAATTVFDMAQSAAEAGNSFSRFAFATGSSTGNNARLMSLGSAIGLSPGDIAGISQRIQGAITGSPEGQAAGLQLGIWNLPGMFGQQDYGAQTLQVVRALRSMNPDARLRWARTADAEDLLPLTQLSDRQFNYIDQDASVRAKIMSPEMIQKSADFQAALGRFQNAIQNLMTAIGSNGLDLATRGLNLLADGINGLAGSGQALQDLGRVLVDLVSGDIGAASFDLIKMHNDATVGWEKAIKENTTATQQNTAAVVGQPGFFGKITRGEPLGQGMNGMAYREAIDAGIGYRLSPI
jgi:hypothetical protein